MSNLSLWSSYEDVSHQLFPLVPVSVTELKSAPLCWLRRKTASSWLFKSNLNSENMLLAVFLPPFLSKRIFSGLVWSGFRRCSSLSLPSHSLSSLLSLHDFCKKILPRRDHHWWGLAAQSHPETLPLGTQNVFSSNFFEPILRRLLERCTQKLHSTSWKWRARNSLVSLCKRLWYEV